MASIKGYRFETVQIADERMEFLNTHHGLPVPGGLTKFESGSYAEHADGFYYIPYDADWTSPLGEPIDIELPQPQEI